MTIEAASRQRRGFFRAILGGLASFLDVVAAAGDDISVFDAVVDYGQIVVVDPSASAYGPWGDEAEKAQGFSWSPGAVAFGVPDLDCTCRIAVGRARRVGIGTTTLGLCACPSPCRRGVSSRSARSRTSTGSTCRPAVTA